MVNIKGLGKLEKALKTLASPDTRRGMLKVVGETLHGQTRRRFDEERNPDGTSWPESIRARREGGKTLTRKARLRNSVNWKVEGDKVAIGTNVFYGPYHQPPNGRTTTIRAHTRQMYFRPTRSGRWLFAKASHKRAIQFDVSVPTYQIPIRRFLPEGRFNTRDSRELEDALVEFLQRKVGTS